MRDGKIIAADISTTTTSGGLVPLKRGVTEVACQAIAGRSPLGTNTLHFLPQHKPWVGQIPTVPEQVIFRGAISTPNHSLM